MSTVTIRTAEEADYDSLQSLYQQMLKGLAVNYPDQFKMSGAEIGLKQQTFFNTLVDPNWIFLLAEQDENLIGMVQLSIDEEPESEYRHNTRYAWIEEMIVAEEQDFDAVGRALLEAGEAWAKQQGVSQIDFITYNFNERMATLCEASGYGQVSKRVRKTI